MSLKSLLGRAESRWLVNSCHHGPTAARRLARTPRSSITRGLATESSSKSSSGGKWIFAGLGLAGAAAGGWVYSNAQSDKVLDKPEQVKNPAGPKKLDYQEVYNAVSELLEDENYDDGSYGPVLVRLAWHASGTYDKESGNGGSNGATMRFAPESNHGANAGLHHARNRLEPIKQKFGDDLTYSDLWTLAGVCAVQEMGGPQVPWRPGRQDGLAENCTPDGRLPDGDKDNDHLRKIFYRQGFNDQEIVALSGAHALGRCHSDRSGFDGPWSFSPISFTNAYYQLLLDEKWNKRKWDGPPQFQDEGSKSLMMLMTDMALSTDKSFRPWAEKYAQNEETFFSDFSKVFSKLLENGVPTENWKSGPLTLKTTDEQEA